MHCMCVTNICFQNTVLRSCLRQYILGLPAASDIASVIFFNFSNIFFMLNSHYKKTCIIYTTNYCIIIYIPNYLTTFKLLIQICPRHCDNGRPNKC